MYQHAITRTPCRALIDGLTTATLGKPDYQLALEQHAQYRAALEACRLSVHNLEADENFPDSTFVEDVVVHTAAGAIFTNPGAPSRQAEVALIEATITERFPIITQFQAPATLEGGDILQIGDTFYIGASKRTNLEGANQLIKLLETHNYQGIIVPVSDVLHLKTGVTYLDNNRLLVSGEFIGHPAFRQFEQIVVEADEAYAVNILCLNGTVIFPANFPKTKAKIEALGYPIIEVPMSEFEKIDGSLTCLSVRW